MIHFVTYSADNMSRSRQVCVEAGKKYGADRVWEFTINDISKEFNDDNIKVINADRGVGYWIWKPWIINHVAVRCADGDYVCYCDAGVKFIGNISHLINAMDQDIFLFSNGHSHVHWCKRDVIDAILPGINRKENQLVDVWLSADYQQVQASVILFRINPATRNFIKEWLLWCQMPGFIDDSPSKLPNHPEFAQHRYDQAILTCLQIKYGYKLHYWADALWYWSQRPKWPDDKYPLMFEHHRKRNPGTVTNPEGPTW